MGLTRNSFFNKFFRKEEKFTPVDLLPAATIEKLNKPDILNDGWKEEYKKDMKVIIKPLALAKLSVMENAAKRNEFSGFGFGNIEEGNYVIYDVVLMDIGTFAYTEFAPKKVLALMDRPDHKNMKVWFHLHPLGTGVPGKHNWSGTDERTIKTEPLGGMPELIGWSVSIVKTPSGWVGRIDNYKNKKTYHLDVIFNSMDEVYNSVEEILSEKKKAEQAKKAKEVDMWVQRPVVIRSLPWEEEKGWRDTQNTSISPLFDLDNYYEPNEPAYEDIDTYEDSYIEDWFYSLSDEAGLQLQLVRDEIVAIQDFTKSMNDPKMDNLIGKLQSLEGRLNSAEKRISSEITQTERAIRRGLDDGSY